jgi:hypothetical protein
VERNRTSTTTTTGRTQCTKPNTSNPPRNERAVIVRNGDAIEVLVGGMWWEGRITGCGRQSVRASLGFAPHGMGAPRSESGLPISDAILSAALYGKTWRLSTLAVHRVPLTGQGVRNLNLAAPPRLRNGRHFRKPANWIAICPHPEEAFDGEVIEEPVFKKVRVWNQLLQKEDTQERLAFHLYFETCTDCGAEVPA